MRIPLTPHGIRELVLATLAFGFLAWGCTFFFWPLAVIPVLLWLFCLSFFRDPERTLPADATALVSPADGTVTDIVEVSGAPLLPEPCLRVGIFLSVFNVHVNRSPFHGRVEGLHHKPGRFLDARHPDVSSENEAQDILLRGEAPLGFPVVVRQIAGLIARRIICPLKKGDELARGQRMGMIKFGSRTELLIPLRLKPVALVKIGDTVKGAATPLMKVAGSERPA